MIFLCWWWLESLPHSYAYHIKWVFKCVCVRLRVCVAFFNVYVASFSFCSIRVCRPVEFTFDLFVYVLEYAYTNILNTLLNYQFAFYSIFLYHIIYIKYAFLPDSWFFAGIFPARSVMRSHFGRGHIHSVYAIYNFSHYPLSSRTSHRHRRHTHSYIHSHSPTELCEACRSLSDALYLIETSIIIQMY